MAEQNTHLLEMHADTKAAVTELAKGKPQMSGSILGVSVLDVALTFVPSLVDAAVSAVAVPVESFVVSHKDFVRKFASEKALEYAEKLIEDLKDAAPAK